MKPLEAIRCTLPSCPCECFAPGKACQRTCDSCKHGWVAHALDKLGYRHIFNLGIQVEIVQPNIVFDIASLMLYGAQATPIRLKILLDRLFSVLQHEEVLQVLHGFGWSYEDYARGYILQDASGRVLDKWVVATREEEHIIIQQFLRFGETKSIAQEIILMENRERQDLYVKETTRNESEIKKFIERSNMTMQTFMRPFDTRHLFGSRLPYVPTGSRLMSPPAISLPNFSPTSPVVRDLRPPVVTVGTTSPGTTSPLGRLQTMQPFDYRQESASPSVSPGPPSTERQRNPQPESPKSESPQNLSATSTSSHSTPPPFTPQKVMEVNDNSLSSLTTSTPVTIGATTMILPVITRPQEENGVLNFSIKEDPDISGSSFYGDRKAKHLRKSSNPIKRQWLPTAGFGSTMIGPNGKKRVLCTACNKTFCDKGALKIHYSAVHLKEMHKCSVDGCSMMFSSRRSRNRHSANPNPKLHMPQKRPKLPEGATCIDDGSSPSQKRALSTPPSMVIAPSMLSSSPLGKLDSPDQRAFYSDPSSQLPMFPTAAKRLRLEDEDGPKDLSLPLYKKSTDYQSDLSTPTKDNQSENTSDSEKHDSGLISGPMRSQSRRKNIPTRCAQSEDMYMMSDDNSDDKDPGSRPLRKKDNHTVSSTSHNGNHLHGKEADSTQDKQETGNDESSKKTLNGNSSQEEDDDDDDEDDDEEGVELPEGEDVVDENGAPKGYLKIDALSDQSDNENEGLDFTRTTEDELEENVSISSEQNSNSVGSSEDGKISGDLTGDYDIPIDKENPRKCTACGKIFLNQFGVKIHYQNVHLKLMHRCQVEGCSAAFPSKRSRDRHSCNLNLHRKLMSTSDTDQPKGKDTDDNQNFRANVIQKLYESQDLGEVEDLSETAVKNGHPEPCNSDGEGTENMSDQSLDESSEKLNGLEESGDDLGTLESDGMVTCHICQVKVRDNLVLKEHFELVHPKEMFRCTVKGCEKIFSTRKSRNRHSQNDNLHRLIGSGKRGTTAS